MFVFAIALFLLLAYFCSISGHVLTPQATFGTKFLRANSRHYLFKIYLHQTFDTIQENFRYHRAWEIEQRFLVQHLQNLKDKFNILWSFFFMHIFRFSPTLYTTKEPCCTVTSVKVSSNKFKTCWTMKELYSDN